MRDPSLHITKSQLTQLLKDAEGHFDSELGIPINKLVKYLLKHGKIHSCNNRGLLVSNDKVEKKARNMLRSSGQDTMIMVGILLMVRRKLKHVGVKRIDETSRDWATLKKITEDALNFSNEFQFQDKKKGFYKYLEVGATKMAKFNLMRYLNMYETICVTYQALEKLAEDSKPAVTNKIHDYYVGRIAEQTGLPETYEDNPEKYLYFMLVREQCEKYSIPFKHWINSQFEAFDWQNRIPDPVQLVGPKSTARFNKYCKKHGFDFKKPAPTKKMDFKKILSS